MSKLISLDLTVLKLIFSDYLTLETPVMEGIVQNLTELEELNIDSVTMSTVVPSYLNIQLMILSQLVTINSQVKFPSL